MTSATQESSMLVRLTVIGFILNFIFGVSGSCLEPHSYGQSLAFQIGDAASIMACVVAGRYVGIRGQHIAASAFILLGITHGVSLAASGLQNINIEKNIGVVMPMIPAFVLMYWFTLVPKWLRIAGFISPILFVTNYIRIVGGEDFFGWPSYAGYLTWMAVELLWGWYLIKDLRMTSTGQ